MAFCCMYHMCAVSLLQKLPPTRFPLTGIHVYLHVTSFSSTNSMITFILLARVSHLSSSLHMAIYGPPSIFSLYYIIPYDDFFEKSARFVCTSGWILCLVLQGCVQHRLHYAGDISKFSSKYDF